MSNTGEVNTRMLVIFRKHQREFIKMEAIKKDCAMAKVVRDLVDEAIKRRKSTT